MLIFFPAATRMRLGKRRLATLLSKRVSKGSVRNMSISSPAFSPAQPAIELETILTAARKTSVRRGASVRRSGKSARKSEIAGSALVAALLGVQLSEQVEAAEDLNGGPFAWMRNVKICRGHAGFRGDAVSHADHASFALNGDAHHAAFGEASQFQSFTRLDGDAGMTSGLRGASRRSGHDDHEAGTPAWRPRAGSRDDNDGHEHDPETPDDSGAASGGDATTDAATDSGATGEHTHDTTTTSGSDAGTTSGDATGGHTHDTATTTSGSDAGTGLPHPTDLAKQAEHLALMNLVPVSAATHVAVTNGSWFDPNTWANGQVPGEGARVVIPQGIAVDYDSESPASIFTIRVDGALNFATDVDTFLEVDTFVVTGSGLLTIGTEGSPVDPGVQAVISFADNGPINVAWDPMLLSRGLISHGTVDIHGAEKETFLKVAVDPMKGDTTLTLESAPTGWEVGDKLVLTGTHLVSTKGVPQGAPVNVQTEDEELIITAINGNTITFDRPLAYDHEGARADLKAYVANYSRNIVFQTEGGDATPVHERGHVMMMHSDNVVVKYAEFSELGRTDKSAATFEAGSLTSVAPDSNVRGRYSLHLHRTGVDDQANPAIVEGNSVWGSPGWGFVHHDSNAILSNNAAYDVFGAAFVAETGNETGRWDHNIAIKSLGMNHLAKTFGVGSFDLGRTGTGFWFQGRLVEAVDNVAAGVPSGAGFTYFHRGVDPNKLLVDPSDSSQPESLRYLSGVKADKPNISIFLGNESIATETGLEVIKANPRQDHDLRSVIDNFLAWEVEMGVHLEYTGHYTLRNLDVVASDTAGVPTLTKIGLDLGRNVIDVVVNGANIEGFTTGVRQAKDGINGLDFMDSLDQWDYVYIDVNIKGATYDFTNRTAGDRHLTAADLTDGRLFYNSSFAETQIVQKNGVFDLQGTKTDSIGATPGYKVWDPDYINIAELRGSIEQNGYWTTADGRRVALIEEYYSDRATGDVIKVGVFVEIPSKYVLQAGRFTSTTPAYNGVLDQNSKAPNAVDDTASVTQGRSVVIDVLANDSDPDGDAIQLDGLFSQHGHVVDNHDGTVTYFADPNYKGQDVFYYFVQDSNGDISKAQVTVTVDI